MLSFNFMETLTIMEERANMILTTKTANSIIIIQ